MPYPPSKRIWQVAYPLIKGALSINALRAYVYSSALLGRPRCGLSIWLSLVAIFSALFWVYATFFFHEKMDKARKYLKSAIFESYENGRRRLLGAQSIFKILRELF